MNDTLKEHLAIKNPSTGSAREMLHIEMNKEITRYDLNFAGNTYLVALHHIAAQAARIQELENKLAAAVLYISVNVCDPDTTAEMWEAWKVYQEAMKVQS